MFRRVALRRLPEPALQERHQLRIALLPQGGYVPAQALTSLQGSCSTRTLFGVVPPTCNRMGVTVVAAAGVLHHVVEGNIAGPCICGTWHGGARQRPYPTPLLRTASSHRPCR